MSEIWFIRHGQSLGQLGIDVDQVNPDLSQEGERQAEEIRDRIGDPHFDKVLVSPLRRARRTYELSGLVSRNVSIDYRLVESNFGQSEFYKDYVPDHGAIQVDHKTVSFLRASVDERAESLVRHLRKLDCRRIALFAHWGIFMHLLNEAFGIRHEGWILTKMDNCSFSMISLNGNGKFSLEHWNITGEVL